MNGINEGQERVIGPDADGVVTKRGERPLEDLQAQIAKVDTARAAGDLAAARLSSSIKSRGELREAAVAEAAAAAGEAPAQPGKGAAGRQPVQLEVAPELAKRWADLDVGTFERMRSEDRKDAALEVMAANARHSPAYREALLERHKDLGTVVNVSNEHLEAEARAQARAALQASLPNLQVNETITASRKLSDEKGLTVEIERLTYEGRPIPEIAKAIDERLGENSGRTLDPDETIATTERLVREVQDSLGVPDAGPARERWRETYEQRHDITREGSPAQAASRIEIDPATLQALAEQRRRDTDAVLAEKAAADAKFEKAADDARDNVERPRAEVQAAIDEQTAEALADRRFRDTMAAAEEMGMDALELDATRRDLHRRHDVDGATRDDAGVEPVSRAGGPEAKPNVGQPSREAASGDRDAPEGGPDRTSAPARAVKRPVLEDEVSESVKGRFIVTTQKIGPLDRGHTEFTFRGGEKDGQVAFRDFGKQLSTTGEDRETIRAMLDVAQSKSWRQITVTGEDAFRREAWLEGRLLGLEVNGFSPREADLRRLAELQEQKTQQTNAISASVPERTREAKNGPNAPSKDVPTQADAERMRTETPAAVKNRPMDTPERAKAPEATRDGDTKSRSDIKADAQARAGRDAAAAVGMSQKDPAAAKEVVAGASAAQGDARTRARMDGTTRQEPAAAVDSRQQPNRAAAQPERHIDGDAPLSGKERTVLDAMKASLAQQGYSRQFVDETIVALDQRLREQRTHVGVLLSHGEDRYRHQPRAAASYFVELRTATGVEKVWGVDLPRALEKSKPAIGEMVVLSNTGRKEVQVIEMGQDENGKPKSQWKDTERNGWDIVPLARLTEVQRETALEAAKRTRTGPSVPTFDPAAPLARQHVDPRTRDGRGREDRAVDATRPPLER